MARGAVLLKESGASRRCLRMIGERIRAYTFFRWDVGEPYTIAGRGKYKSGKRQDEDERKCYTRDRHDYRPLNLEKICSIS